jgi:hypothetical protein
MSVNIIAVLALVVGVYLLQRADKKGKDYKAVYAIAGIVILLWGLSMLFVGSPIHIGAMPLVFGISVLGTLYTKGNSQAILGAIAALLFLNIFF